MLKRSISFQGRHGLSKGAGQKGERRGRQGGTQPGSGPGGMCNCPSCGHEITHEVGKRCLDMTCPKCSTRMVRK